jgi:alpha-L-rhamnosidase
MPAIAETETLSPVSIKSYGPKIYVVDFGKNSAGYCRLELKAPKGTKITLKYGEQLASSGRLTQDFINKYFQKEGPLVKRLGPKPVIDSSEVFQMDTYYFRGDKKQEVFIPDFTYHGFQYVEIESSEPVVITKKNIQGIFVHTNLPKIGNFECSNPTFNKLYAATMRSYLSNLHSIPTDCPQREKNGWTADAYISIDLALLNYDGLQVYEKWMRDFIDNQNTEGRIAGIVPSANWGYIDWVGPTWDVAMFAIPEALYRYYGQTRAIEQLYPTMVKYLNYLSSREKDGMITFGIGDWVPANTKTPTDFTSMCSYFYMNKLMSEFSVLINKNNTLYKNKAAALKDIINSKYFNEQTGVYANGSQTSFAYPLFIGLVPERNRQKLAAQLNDVVVKNNYSVDFGMLGSRYVPRVLAQYGFQETVVKMLLNDAPPSWTSWIKAGLTTLPEWFQKEEYDKASLNHVFLGDISAWMTNYLAGIRQPENAVGFQNIIINPFYTKELNSVKGEYLSVNGKITSAWERKGNRITLKVSIPQNCKATVITNKTLELGPGNYKFDWNEN